MPKRASVTTSTQSTAEFERGSEGAEDTLEALKARFGASTDGALADALQVGRSTVTSWRRRGRVPGRYARLVDDDMTKRLSAVFNYDALAEEERAALCLAMMRMHDGFMAQARSSYPDFLQKSGFIPVQIRHHMEKALLELMAAMEERGFEDARQCLNALVFEEFFSD